MIGQHYEKGVLPYRGRVNCKGMITYAVSCEQFDEKMRRLPWSARDYRFDSLSREKSFVYWVQGRIMLKSGTKVSNIPIIRINASTSPETVAILSSFSFKGLAWSRYSVNAACSPEIVAAALSS